MFNRQKRAYSNCSICQEDDEHCLVHILTCPHQNPFNLRATLMDALQLWLVREHTHPDITTFFITGLTLWFQDPYGNEILVTCADINTRSTP